MSESETPPRAGRDALWRWLVGGLVGGAVLLGLLIGAYAIGYNRDHGGRGTGATTATGGATSTTGTAGTTTAGSAATGPVAVTPALVARGKALFASDGCSGCHSLSTAAGAGPGLGGLAGRTVTLDTGATVTADDAYLLESIDRPDAKIVKGYGAGVMSAALAPLDLAAKPADVRALVAYVKSLR